MLVSPNHRVLVANARSAIKFSEREVLIAAKHLSTAGVHTVQSSGTTYIRFMCDRHEVVLANGIWTEDRSSPMTLALAASATRSGWKSSSCSRI